MQKLTKQAFSMLGKFLLILIPFLVFQFILPSNTFAQTSAFLNFSSWQSLGGILTDAPGNLGAREYFAFARGTDNALYLKHSGDGVNFSDWDRLGGVLTSNPTAVSFKGDVYFLVRGSDNALYIAPLSLLNPNIKMTTPWTRVGGVLTGGPAASVFGDKLVIFVPGTDGLYMTTSTDGKNFSSWQNLGGVPTSSPSSLTFNGQLFVLVRGTDNALYLKTSQDNFQNWQRLGGILKGAPSVATDGQNILVAAWGTGDHLYLKNTLDDANNWVDLGGRLTSSPAVTFYQGSFYIAARGSDNAFWQIHTVTGNTPPSVNPPPSVPNLPVPNFTVTNNTVYSNNTPIRLRGVNWFGFDTKTHAVHGLWARNYKDIISQMKSVGFNAVRLPFCPPVLRNSSVSAINYHLNPDLNGLGSLQVFDAVINELNRQGMYIVLDHHTNDCETLSPLWYTSFYPDSQWINDLVFIANRYKNLPFFLGIDTKNEPYDVTWATGNMMTDYKLATERAGKAILAANPNILIFFGGMGWVEACGKRTTYFWGLNFEPFACASLNQGAIPLNKLVISPHIYGPDLYGNYPIFNESDFPLNFIGLWDRAFGFLLSQGYSVIPGEWGGKFGTGTGDPRDVKLQQTFVDYMQKRHICSAFYWSWNPNTATLGIVQNDWKTVWPDKISFLNNYFNNCN